MINLHIHISNPFAKDNFRNILSKAVKISTNKVIDGEIIYYSRTIFSAWLNITTRQDHGGFKLEIGLLRYLCVITLYDIRHWDEEKSQWQVYE